MIGRTLSNYRVLRKLGGGGMGVVYEAIDINLNRRVALKFLPESLQKDAKALERFEQEARAASLLSHPNICAIHEIEEHNGQPFLVMELLEGEDLKQRLKKGPLAPEEVLSVAAQIADALETAHAKGIVHRDMKPANIFLSPEGQARLLDFGLARLAPQRAATETSDDAEYESLTSTGELPGTAAYMSPEQVRGEDLDPRTDIFSFGAVLYEMATGKKPFVGRNVAMIAYAILNHKPESPRRMNPALPLGLESIVGKALEKRREKRYQNAGELRDDLRFLQREQESSAVTAAWNKPLHLPVTTKTFRRRGPLAWWQTVALIVAVLALAAAGWLFYARRAVPANSVAVLPFQDLNKAGGEDLRFVLADQTAATLARNHRVDLRPVLTPQKYSGGAVELQQAGRELHVATLVTGHYLQQNGRLEVTLAAVDTRNNRVIWQESLQVDPQQALSPQLEGVIDKELVPRLAGPEAPRP